MNDRLLRVTAVFAVLALFGTAVAVGSVAAQDVDFKDQVATDATAVGGANDSVIVNVTADGSSAEVQIINESGDVVGTNSSLPAAGNSGDVEVAIYEGNATVPENHTASLRDGGNVEQVNDTATVYASANVTLSPQTYDNGEVEVDTSDVSPTALPTFEYGIAVINADDGTIAGTTGGLSGSQTNVAVDVGNEGNFTGFAQLHVSRNGQAIPARPIHERGSLVPVTSNSVQLTQGAFFDVTSVEGPRVARDGAIVEYDVTVRNNGSTSDMQPINLTADEDNDGNPPSAVPNATTPKSLQLDANETSTLTFSGINTSFLPNASESFTNDYDITALSDDDSQTEPLKVGTDSDGTIFINVRDDNGNLIDPLNDPQIEQNSLGVALFELSDFQQPVDQNIGDAQAVRTFDEDDDLPVTFGGLAVGPDDDDEVKYVAVAGFDTPKFESGNTQVELFDPTNNNREQTIRLDRVVRPDELEVDQLAESAFADGEDTIPFVVNVTGDDGQPFEGSEVEVTHNGEDGTIFFNGQQQDTFTGTTDQDGQFRVEVASNETQSVSFTFEEQSTSDVQNSPVTKGPKNFFLEGEATVSGTVFDVNGSASGVSDRALEEANVWTVQRSTFLQNSIPVSVPLTEGESLFYRVREAEFDSDGSFNRTKTLDQGEILDITQDYRIDNNGTDRVDEDGVRRFNESISRVRELNTTDAAVGSGFAVEARVDNPGNNTVFATPLEPGEYIIEVSTTAPNASDERFTDPSNPPELFSPINDLNDNVEVFRAPANLTLEEAQRRTAEGAAGQKLWDSTDAQGDYVLDNLFSDFQSGVEYVLIANKPGYEIDFVDPLVTEDGAFFEDGEDENFELRQVEVDPGFVNVTNFGLHPPLAETGGGPDPGQIEPYDDKSDAFAQEVPRDGSVDVINVVTRFTEDSAPTPANVTISVPAAGFNGQFLDQTIGDGNVISRGGNSITINTGQDGEETVLLEADESGETIQTSVDAVLEIDSSAFDSTEKEFVGVISYDSGSVSGIVTNQPNEPIPNSVVWAGQFEDVNGNEVRISPDEPLGTNRPEILNTSFEVVFDPTPGAPNSGDEESEIVNGSVLRDGYDFGGIPSVSIAPNPAGPDIEDGFNLLDFPSIEQNEAQYTLSPVPAQQSPPLDGVEYQVLNGVQFQTGADGQGSGSDSVNIGFTVDGNIVIDADPLNGDPGNGDDTPAGFPDFTGSDGVFDAIDADGNDDVTPGEISTAVGEFLNDGTIGGNDVSPGEASQIVGWFLNQ